MLVILNLYLLTFLLFPQRFGIENDYKTDI